MADDIKTEPEIDLYGDEELIDTDIAGDNSLAVADDLFGTDETSTEENGGGQVDDDDASEDNGEPPAKRVKLEPSDSSTRQSTLSEDDITTMVASELPDGLIMGVSVQGRVRQVAKADLGHPNGIPLELQLVPDQAKLGSVYVGNLSWWTRDLDLANALVNAGIKDVVAVRVYENRTNGQSKGFACVETSSEASARRVMTKVKEFAVHGQIPIAQLTSRTTLNSFEALSRRGTERPAEVSLTNRVGPVTAQGLKSRAGNAPASTFVPQSRPSSTSSGPTPPTRATPLLQRRGLSNPLPPRPVLPRPPHAWMPPGPHAHHGLPPPPFDPLMLGARPPLPPAFPVPHVLPGAAMMRMPSLPPPLPPRPPMPSPASAAAAAAAAAARPPMPIAFPHHPHPHHPAPHVNPAFLAANSAALNPAKLPVVPPPAASLPTASQTHAAMAAVAANAMTRLKSSTLGQASEEELQESMKRNHAISTSAILRAMQDANAGDFSGAVDTLKTAISLIKQSITATAESSVALIQSLQECLSGIESQAYTTKSSSSSRPSNTGRGERDVSRERSRRTPEAMEEDYHRSRASHRSSHMSSSSSSSSSGRHHDHHDPYRSDRHDSRRRR